MKATCKTCICIGTHTKAQHRLIHTHIHTHTCTLYTTCTHVQTPSRHPLSVSFEDATCSNLKINVSRKGNAFFGIIIVIDITASFRDGANKSLICNDLRNISKFKFEFLSRETEEGEGRLHLSHLFFYYSSVVFFIKSNYTKYSYSR